MAAVTICSDSTAQENKVCHCFHCFPIYLPWSDGTRCHDLSFLNVEFQASFFTLLSHFHQNENEIVTSHKSYFRTRGPGNEHGTNKPPPTRRAWERSKGDTPYWPPRILFTGIHLGWAMSVPPGRTLGPNDWSETSQKLAHHQKSRDPEPHGRAVLLGSFVLLLSTRHPFPMKSLALSAHMSPRTIHFWVSDKSPLLGPRSGPPFSNNYLIKSVNSEYKLSKHNRGPTWGKVD